MRSIGLPADIARLYYRTATQPFFKAHFAPVCRFSREAWLAFQLPGFTEDQLAQSELAHIWRADRKAQGDAAQFDKAECKIQALVAGFRAFQ